VIRAEARKALEAALGERIRFDVPMSRHTSLRVGGLADALANPTSREQLELLVRVCAEQRIPHICLGAGFNTIVLDGGIEGVVIQLKKFRALAREGEDGVRAEAGVSHSQLSKFCIAEGLSGLEFAAGIPGSIGGWVAMNAGIGSREVVDVVREVEVMGPRGGAVQKIAASELEFAYRALRGLEPGTVIVSALFEVEVSDSSRVRALVERLLAHRADTQPLDVPSCGSVFKNPEGDYAGRLIEAAGMKGERAGDAEITQVHANFIANRGQASAAQILSLIARAKQAVRESQGVELETEVEILGREAS